MAIIRKPPHFALLPFLAQGHLIPMVDIAKLLANRGVIVSILLTTHSFNRVEKVLNRAISSGLTIRVLHLHFPGVEAGLPEGCQSLDMVPSMDDVHKFTKACEMMREQVEEFLLDLNPTCLIADMCFPWATDMALKLRIPRLVFHGTSCFALLCLNVLRDPKVLESVSDDREYFVLPGLPDRIEITKVQLTGFVDEITAQWAEFQGQLLASEDEAVGTVANTFLDLEPAYVQQYVTIRQKKVWCIGPVSLCNVEDSDKEERGNTAAINGHDCLKWLILHKPGSVVYACLGSISRMSNAQLKEMGLGLEASNRPFVWVIREASDEFESWLSEEKFEERNGGRGLLIRGWAPQVLILSHPSVGGFITHCGWNSTLEGVTAGLPMITWPVFAEQFSNERFIVDVIKTGIKVGVEVPVVFGIDKDNVVQVKSEDVRGAVEELMEGGERGEERRERARKLGEAAKKAVEEGGSSHLSMSQLIHDMVELKAKYVE